MFHFTLGGASQATCPNCRTDIEGAFVDEVVRYVVRVAKRQSNGDFFGFVSFATSTPERSTQCAPGLMIVRVRVRYRSMLEVTRRVKGPVHADTIAAYHKLRLARLAGAKPRLLSRTRSRAHTCLEAETHRQAGRRAGRQAERHTERITGRRRDGDSNRETKTQTERGREAEGQTQSRAATARLTTTPSRVHMNVHVLQRGTEHGRETQ